MLKDDKEKSFYLTFIYYFRQFSCGQWTAVKRSMDFANDVIKREGKKLALYGLRETFFLIGNNVLVIVIKSAYASNPARPFRYMRRRSVKTIKGAYQHCGG